MHRLVAVGDAVNASTEQIEKPTNRRDSLNRRLMKKVLILKLYSKEERVRRYTDQHACYGQCSLLEKQRLML
jgi:hypothetical protein